MVLNDRILILRSSYFLYKDLKEKANERYKDAKVKTSYGCTVTPVIKNRVSYMIVAGWVSSSQEYDEDNSLEDFIV